jgi:mRNA-degrading endonuclease HigB of HigAB toxin-antitoxin module
MSWARHFDEPIPLPRGRRLVTLKDAANYIQKLPKAEQDLDEWQAAVEACSWSSSSRARP